LYRLRSRRDQYQFSNGGAQANVPVHQSRAGADSAGKPSSQESQKGVIRLMQRCSDPGLDAPAAWRGSRASEKRLMKDGV
jgi:hypothetical protein